MKVARWRIPALILLVTIAAVLALANLPVETRQGVDFVTSTSTLPLYVKALEFAQRDVSYGRLAGRVVGDRITPEARTMALFDWTRTNIRDTPEGFPIIDDHVWHIIVRGYGEDDQKAAVFTTLATYAGVPAFWMLSEDASRELPLSFAWIDRQWTLFDVANGIVFRTPDGRLATAEAIARTPGMVDRVSAGRTYRGRPYASYFSGFRQPTAPEILRSEMQMIWPRVAYRVKGLVGLGRREWQ